MIIQVSIIIVNYNCEGHTCNCIDSIYKFVSGPWFEIIVVDNASSNNAALIISKRFPEVKLIINNTNLGFGSANNIGARNAAGKYLFFLNPDTLLLDNSVLVFLEFLESHGSNVVCCGGNLIQNDGSPNRSYGNLPSLLQELGDKGFKKLFPGYFNRYLALGKCVDFAEIKQVPYLVGASIFIRRGIFESISGFDEGFFMYFEETDLFNRLFQKGFKTYLLPECKIIHLEGATTDNPNSFNYRWWGLWEKSKYYYFQKHYGRIITFLVKGLQIGSFIVNHFFGRTRIDTKRAIMISLKA